MVQFAATAHYPFFRKGDIMKKRVLTISLAGILIACLLTLAGCKRHGHHKGAEFMVDYISETLDLNESQQAQLDGIKDELMAKAQGMHADKASMHAELVTQLRSEEIDQELVKAKIAEHRAKMDEIVDLIVVRLAEFQQHTTKTVMPEMLVRNPGQA